MPIKIFLKNSTSSLKIKALHVYLDFDLNFITLTEVLD